MIKLKIDVTKIDKARLFKGAKGTYIDAVLVEKPNDYGDDGFIQMDRTKEEREQNVKTPIIGNWKHIGGKPAQKPNKPAPAKPDPSDLDEDRPF